MTMKLTTWLALLPVMLAAHARAADITVTLESMPESGVIAVMVFDDPNRFVDFRSPVTTVVHAVENGSTVVVRDLPPGTYAVVAYADRNGDGQLNENFIGIPREPIGFSNRYWPQGPPTFARAAFPLDGDEVEMEIALQSVFGELGLIGVGVGAIVKTSPYREADSTTVQPIPAVSYIGDRLQIFGTRVQWGLVNGEKAGLAATVGYRFGAYEEDDSRVLAGMGDREDTIMGGLSWRYKLPDGVDLGLSYEHDVLDRIGGGIASIELDKSFQTGAWTFSPGLALRWQSAEFVRDEAGVKDDQAAPGRPVYRPDDAWIPEVQFGLFYELPRDWRVIVSTSLALLPSAFTDSPLIEDDYIVSSFLAINRLF